jgi:hypothetical protein
MDAFGGEEKMMEVDPCFGGEDWRQRRILGTDLLNRRWTGTWSIGIGARKKEDIGGKMHGEWGRLGYSRRLRRLG